MRNPWPSAVASLLVAGILSGCVVRPNIVPPTAMPAPAPTHEVDKSYKLGVPQSAVVGNPMIRVKDYWVTRRDTGVYTLPIAVKFGHHPFGKDEFFPSGTPVRLAGYVNENGVNYRVVVFPGQDARFFPLLVDSSGKYAGIALNMMAGGAPFHPGGGKILTVEYSGELNFPDSTIESVSSDGGYINYELIYAGSSGDSINLIYREYTADNLARAAFNQNLTYDKSSSSIRFKNLHISILEANNEEIKFVVDSDQ